MRAYSAYPFLRSYKCIPNISHAHQQSDRSHVLKHVYFEYALIVSSSCASIDQLCGHTLLALCSFLSPFCLCLSLYISFARALNPSSGCHPPLIAHPLVVTRVLPVSDATRA